MKETSLRQKITLIIFGLFLCAVLLEIGLRIGGFVILSLQEQRNKASLGQKGAYRIMCLGESTTTAGGKNSYPNQLQQVLNDKDIGVKFSVINKGICGTKTGSIVSQLEHNIEKHNPDMIVTMMGINDEEGICLASHKKLSLFIESLRTYKLIKLLCLHIAHKAGKERTADIDKGHTDLGMRFYAGLGWYYMNAEEYDKAEEMYKKAIELNPKDDTGYTGLAWNYLHMGECDKAVEIFKKAIQINPRNEGNYIELGRRYMFAEEYDEAEEMYKKAIEVNPKSGGGYAGLGWYCINTGQYDKAEEMYKKAIELNPKDDTGYTGLAWDYIHMGEYGKAKETLEKYRRINPNNESGYSKMGRYCMEIGEYDKAKEMYKKAAEINARNDRSYGGLSNCYRQLGDYDLTREYSKKAEDMRLEYFNPITLCNYRKLKRIAMEKGLKLVCVQYPMRSVKPLKKVFKDNKDVAFVDNEATFKEGVEREGYDEYFYDVFAGDFGHCTDKGNRLLAENIANVILKEYFNR